MAWSVELSVEVDRALSKLDAQHAKRILKFLHERVAKLTIRAASEKRCTARAWASSGNTAWAITGSSARSKTTGWSCLFFELEIAKKSTASPNAVHY